MKNMFGSGRTDWNNVEKMATARIHWHIAGRSMIEYYGIRAKIDGYQGIYTHMSSVDPTQEHGLDEPSCFLPAELFNEEEKLIVTWPGQPYRRFLNMTLPQVRRRVMDMIVVRAGVLGLKMLCCDNFYWCLPKVSWPITLKGWRQAFIDFAHEARERHQNYTWMYNVAADVVDYPEMIQRIGSISHALCLENARHPNLTEAQREAEYRAYELFVAQGGLLLLLDCQTPRRNLTEWVRPIAEKYNTTLSGVYVGVKE